MSIKSGTYKLREKANSFFSEKASCNEDFVPYKNTGLDLSGISTQAVNFQYTLRTGEIPARKFMGSSNLHDTFATQKYDNLYIDQNSDDKYTHALKTIKENSIARLGELIQNNPSLMALMTQDVWSYEDRTKWEVLLSTIVSEETDKFSALNRKNYRTEGTPFSYKENTMIRSPRLNDVSSDMNQTFSSEYAKEWDCEHLTATQGYIMQDVENNVLPETKIPGNYKTISNYFFIGNQTSESGEGGHAVVMSSATAHIFDRTIQNQKSIMIQSKPQYVFDDFTNGKPLVAHNPPEHLEGIVFKNSYVSPQEAHFAREHTPDQEKIDYYQEQINAEISAYSNFPTEINYKGEDLTFAEAVKNPELYDMIYSMYESAGDTEALDHMRSINFYANQIEKIEKFWETPLEEQFKTSQVQADDNYTATPKETSIAPAL